MPCRLAVYVICPIEGRRRLFVMPNPTAEQAEHYTSIGAQIAAGARYRTVGLYGFAEVDVTTGKPGPISDYLVHSGIRTIRIEEKETAVQDTLMEVPA